jgi:hypothetical protein
LDAEFPHWRGPLLQLHETQAMTADFLAAEALRALSWQPNTFTEPVRGKKDSSGGLSVNEADFFAQSPIIREEALFQALDALGAASPRRTALRSFAAGRQNVRDLGTARLERTAGSVSVKRVPAAGERGFSVLIKKPGVYKLNGVLNAPDALALIVRAGDDAGCGALCASFPFALRTVRGGVCFEVRDKEGRAALFDICGKLLAKRDGLGEATVYLEAVF